MALHGVSIGAARANYHKVRARRKAGWSKAEPCWHFTKCPECAAMIDARGDDWLAHQEWHEELVDALAAALGETPDTGTEPVYEQFDPSEETPDGTDER